MVISQSLLTSKAFWSSSVSEYFLRRGFFLAIPYAILTCSEKRVLGYSLNILLSSLSQVWISAIGSRVRLTLYWGFSCIDTDHR